MNDERIVKLLEEIRDLQQAHIENYRDALKNQEESIALQKKAVRRWRVSMIALFIFLIVFGIVMVYFSK